MSGGAHLGAAFALAACLAGLALEAEPLNISSDGTRRRVAITFDDLPAARSSFRPELLENPAEFIRWNQTVLRRLRRMKVPAAGFVSSSFRPKGWDAREVHALLETWDQAGAPLGNHTSSHWDYHETDPEAYFADLLHGQQFLESVLGKPPAGQKYFRAPYLHRGASHAARERLAQFLDEHSYTVAPVTIDLQDWVFAEIYAWADANGDSQRKSAAVAAYLQYLEAGIAHYALLSAGVLGRQAPHVALLHANALNYDHIEQVIERFRRQGFEFIRLDAAISDPIYQEMPSASGSWVRGWREREGLPLVDAPDPHRYLGSLYSDYRARR